MIWRVPSARSYTCDAGDRLGDLLAVRADVLDRGGAGRAGDAGEALQAGPAVGDGGGDQVVPRLAGLDPYGDGLGVLGDDPQAPGAHQHDGAGEAGVADHHVAAAGQDQRPARRAALPDRLDELVGAAGGRTSASAGAAEPQRGVAAPVEPGSARSASVVGWA